MTMTRDEIAVGGHRQAISDIQDDIAKKNAAPVLVPVNMQYASQLGPHDALTMAMFSLPDLALDPRQDKTARHFSLKIASSATGPLGPRPYRPQDFRYAAAGRLPWRERTAVVIDEEEDYASFLGYCLHLEGFRVIICTTEAEIKACAEMVKSDPHVLVIQDVQLNLKSEERSEAKWHFNLEERCTVFPGIVPPDDHPGVRVIVVTTKADGQQAEGDTNSAYIKKRKWTLLDKPIGGIYVMRNFIRKVLEQEPLADDWNPLRATLRPQDNKNHAAPAFAQECASLLIERARRFRSEGCTVCDWVRGALVTLQAQEVLQRQTATMSLEALSLQHQFEALIECRFFGVNYDFAIAERLRDISQETKILARAYRSPRLVRFDVAGNVINGLVLIFRDEGRFEQEIVCLARMRLLRCWLIARRDRNWLYRLGATLMLYPVLLMSNLGVFVLALFLWVLGLSYLFAITTPDGSDFFFASCSLDTWLEGLRRALFCFFPVQGPPLANETLLNTWNLNTVLVLMGILSGYFHLGIFISHIYAIFSRR